MSERDSRLLLDEINMLSKESDLHRLFSIRLAMGSDVTDLVSAVELEFTSLSTNENIPIMFMSIDYVVNTIAASMLNAKTLREQIYTPGCTMILVKTVNARIVVDAARLFFHC